MEQAGALTDNALTNVYGIRNCNFTANSHKTAGCMSDGNLWAATISYMAFVGFTSGTGAGCENHDILNWKFSNTTELGTTTPEPWTTLLLAAGLLRTGAALKRRRT